MKTTARSGWGRRSRSVAWYPYVEEDQEAQSSYASQQGEPRQAPKHGTWLTSAETFLVGLTVGDSAERWALLGFQPVSISTPASSVMVDDRQTGSINVLEFDNGALWCVDRTSPTFVVARSDASPGTSDSIDGVPVEFVEADGDALGTSPMETVVSHPNGAASLDHIVINTDSLERTSDAVERVLGLPLLRVRTAGEGPRQIRQGFHRFTNPREMGAAGTIRGCIIEVVQAAQHTSGSDRDRATGGLFGAVVVTSRLDELATDLGEELMSRPRPAVQPGRSIATVRSAAGLPIAFAFMTPEVPRPGRQSR